MVSIIIQFNIHPVLKTILFDTQLSQNFHLRNSCMFKRNSETKNTASVPIPSWQIDGQTVETVADFIWGGSKITADGDCSHEIKRRSLLGRKVMTNPHSILKIRDITLSTKIGLVKAMIFPVVMYGCASWTTKKTER